MGQLWVHAPLPSAALSPNVRRGAGYEPAAVGVDWARPGDAGGGGAARRLLISGAMPGPVMGTGPLVSPAPAAAARRRQAPAAPPPVPARAPAAKAPARAAGATPVPDGATLVGDSPACPGLWRYDSRAGARRLYPSQAVMRAWGAPAPQTVRCEVLNALKVGAPIPMPASAAPRAAAAAAAAPAPRARAAAAAEAAAARPLAAPEAAAVVAAPLVPLDGAGLVVPYDGLLQPRGDGAFAVLPGATAPGRR
ncbi:MAG: hypothetical protein J3K34DRAFT_479376 [Monoraphidium minutum]|nr:MAG: hypothetical protein J3K34DRAFT_479376 [Monoraphidium minutum]